jgi:hypothetical protein
MLDLALDSRLCLNDEFDCALQEIDMILNTENTELLGNPLFGVNIEQFLWTLTPQVESLQDYLRNKILSNSVFVQKFNFNIICEFYTGEYRSVYLVNIILSDPETGQVAKRKYQYQ